MSRDASASRVSNACLALVTLRGEAEEDADVVEEVKDDAEAILQPNQ
jgi:hypothetical protein